MEGNWIGLMEKAEAVCKKHGIGERKQLHGLSLIDGGRTGTDDREFEISGWNMEPNSNLVEMAISWKLEQ